MDLHLQVVETAHAKADDEVEAFGPFSRSQFFPDPAGARATRGRGNFLDRSFKGNRRTTNRGMGGKHRHAGHRKILETRKQREKSNLCLQGLLL